jgi:hypothetical protein
VSLIRGQRRILSGALLCVASLSCGDGTGPAGSSVLSTALAQFAGVEPYFSTGLRRGNAAEVGPFGAVPSSCLFVAASTSFVCPEITTNGISVSRSYQLLDVGGQPLGAFDQNTVNAIRVTSQASGTYVTPATFTQPAVTTSFTSAGEHTYGGLLSGIREINGEATTVATVTKSGKSTNTTSELVISRIAPPLTQADVNASDGFGFPKSGKITTAVTGTDTLGVAFNAQVETTFNGTPIVTTRVARDGGPTVTYNCEYSKTAVGSSTQTFVTCSQP